VELCHSGLNGFNFLKFPWNQIFAPLLQFKFQIGLKYRNQMHLEIKMIHFYQGFSKPQHRFSPFLAFLCTVIHYLLLFYYRINICIFKGIQHNFHRNLSRTRSNISCIVSYIQSQNGLKLTLKIVLSPWPLEQDIVLKFGHHLG